MNPARLETLLDRHFDKIATAAERDELEQALLESDAARGRFWRRAESEWLVRRAVESAANRRSVALADERACQSQRALPPGRLARWRRLSRQPKHFSLAVAATVIGIVLTAMYLVVPPVYRAITRSNSPSYEVVAQLVGEHEAVWAEGQIGASPGAHLVAGHRMELQSGIVQVDFRRGARVVLEGPAVFVALGPNEGSLVEGKLAARIDADAKGFRVRTPRGSVTDLGTEFAVEVNRDGNEQVHVLEGAVQVRWDIDGLTQAYIRQLRAGEALSLAAASSAKPQSLPAAPQRFAIRLPLPEPLVGWTFDDETANKPKVSLQGNARMENGRLLLDDANDYAVLHDAEDRPLNLGTYTISVWVRPAAAGAQNVLVRTDQHGAQVSFSHQLWIDDGGHFQHYTFDGKSRWLAGVSPAQTGQWRHVALTAASRGPMSLFVDGRREAHWSEGLGNVWNGGDRFQLGGPATAWQSRQPLSGFQGELDNLAVYDVVLSAKVIQELAQQSPRDD